MPTKNVLPIGVIDGTRYTASSPNPGTSSHGGLTYTVVGLSAADLADTSLEITLTVELQFVAGGSFIGELGGEFNWRGGTGQPNPTVSVRNPSYRCARCAVSVSTASGRSKLVSLGVNFSTPG